MMPDRGAIGGLGSTAYEILDTNAAMNGYVADAFYTTPQDHENCAVGAFTHGVTLSPAKAKELEGLIGTMVHLQYLRSEEVAGIPHRGSPMETAGLR